MSSRNRREKSDSLEAAPEARAVVRADEVARARERADTRIQRHFAAFGRILEEVRRRMRFPGRDA